MSEVQVTLEQVVELVKQDENVREAIRGEFVTPEAFTTFLDTDEGKKLIQPKLDSFASKSIETWKNNHLEKIKQEAVLSANPTDTPEQRQIKELQMKFQEQEKKAILAEQSAYALSLAQQKELPSGLVKYFVGDTAEQTLSKMNTYEVEFKSALQMAIEKQLGGSGRNHLPENPNVGSPQGSPVKKLSEMSYQEASALYMSNPQEYARRASLE